MGSVNARLTGATRPGRVLARLSRELPAAALEEQLRFAEDRAVPILRTHAPKGATLQLSRDIHAQAVPGRGEVLVRADPRASDPKSRRFPYLHITRVGHIGTIATKEYRRLHMQEELTPRQRSYWKRKGGGRPRALRFFINGKVMFRFYTKGYHPKREGKGDWVEHAGPELEQQSQLMARRLGRRIATRLVGA